jgi:hypothetical protein
MTDIYPPTRQREALLKLIEALGCRDACLRRDECGDWAVLGKQGHIYAIPGTLDRPKAEGFQIYFRGAPKFEEPADSKAWTWAKKWLKPFCEVTNDGDTEAEIIRDKLGIPKKREVSEEERARLAGMGHRFSARGDDVAGDYSPLKPGAEPADASGAGNDPEAGK